MESCGILINVKVELRVSVNIFELIEFENI